MQRRSDPEASPRMRQPIPPIHLGVHHLTVGLVLPACAMLVLKTEGRSFVLTRRLPIAAALPAVVFLWTSICRLPPRADRS